MPPTQVIKEPTVYLMTNKKNGTLYTGMTAFLQLRTHLHRTGAVKGFAKKYGLKMLVYYERQPDLPTAYAREKQIKGWRRQWKLELIHEFNPEWEDLFGFIVS